MKIAVVFNEAYPETTNEYQIEMPKKLGFKPYFDITQSDPIKEYKTIAQALRKSGYNVYILNIHDNINIFLKDLEKNKPDVIFNLVEIYKDKPRLEASFSGILELLGIPYTGAPPQALANCQSKILTKRILGSVGIRTPRYTVIKQLRKNYRHGLHYPVIVKPALEDASVGIENDSIVTNHRMLRKRIEHVFNEFKQPALLEEYIRGRELNVAVFGDEKPKVLPISEIDFSKMPDYLYNIVSFQAKWDPLHEAYHKTIPICPAKLPKKTKEEVEQIAIKCFKIMGCRDYARVDMRLSKEDNKLYVLEVNPNPDLQKDAGFMRSAKQAGYSYSKTLKKIVEFALKRNGKTIPVL